MDGPPEAPAPIWDHQTGWLDPRKRTDQRAAAALRGRALAVTMSLVELLHETLRGLGNDGPGRKNRVGAGVAQQGEVLARDHAADGDHRLVKTELAEGLFQRRDEREVAGGERRNANDMDLLLGRKRRHLLRSRKQRPDFDVEPEVGERRGNDLLPAVMSILAHLGDQNPGSAALVLGEALRPMSG
jgi:hypothetical protein